MILDLADIKVGESYGFEIKLDFVLADQSPFWYQEGLVTEIGKSFDGDVIISFKESYRGRLHPWRHQKWHYKKLTKLVRLA